VYTSRRCSRGSNGVGEWGGTVEIAAFRSLKRENVHVYLPISGKPNHFIRVVCFDAISPGGSATSGEAAVTHHLVWRGDHYNNLSPSTPTPAPPKAALPPGQPEPAGGPLHPMGSTLPSEPTLLMCRLECHVSLLLVSSRRAGEVNLQLLNKSIRNCDG
jgi:hypothetical protein